MLKLNLARGAFPAVALALGDAMARIAGIINWPYCRPIFDSAESVFKAYADPSVQELALACAHAALSDLLQDFEWEFANEDEKPVMPDPLAASAGYAARSALKLAVQFLDSAAACPSVSAQQAALTQLLRQFTVLEVETPALMVAEVVRMPRQMAG